MAILPVIHAAFSPCPNDTHIFYGCIQGASTPRLQWKTQLADVEQLNQVEVNALMPEVIKLSVNAYARLQDHYEILDSGAALGFGCGPLLIANTSIPASDFHRLHCALPGTHTTAALLLSMACPEIVHKTQLIFHEIETAILTGKVDCGVIIHESRFTFMQKGLQLLLDLGAWWEGKMHMPLPLGIIAVRRDLPSEIKKWIQEDLFLSVKYATERPEATFPFVEQWSQEKDPSIIHAHIQLYVNTYTQMLDASAKSAIRQLVQKSIEMNGYQPLTQNLFLYENNS